MNLDRDLVQLARLHPWYRDQIQENARFEELGYLTRNDLYDLIEPAELTRRSQEPIYWSPSSGTSSRRLFFFPSLKSENERQRRWLAPYFTKHGLLVAQDRFLNLFPSGALGRGSEIFESFAYLCGASSFPLGHKMAVAEIDQIAHLFQPNVIGGMPNALLDLAAEATQRSRSYEKVIFGGEALTPKKCAMLRKAFGTEHLYGVYGSAEAGILGVGIDSSGTPLYEIPASLAHVEILAPDGSGIGEIVVSNRVRRSFPLLRYRTGDLGQLERTASTLEDSYLVRYCGRVSSSFQFDGEVVLVDDILDIPDKDRKIDGIQFILSQKDGRDHLEILIVPTQEHGFAHLHEQISCNLASLRGSSISMRRAQQTELIRRGYANKPPIIVDLRA